MKRAHDHLNALNNEIADFLKTDPYIFEPEMDEEFWRYQRLRVIRQPPLWWGVIVGDFAHNARSALDHLIWQLVLANRKLPGSTNQFPIFSTEKEWNRQIEYGRVPPKYKRRRPMLKGVSKVMQTRIRELQPYQRPHVVNALDRLSWLNNVDKHRTIHPGYGVTPVEEPKLDVLDPDLTLDEVSFPFPRTRYEDGAVLAAYQIRNKDGSLHTEREVDMHLRFRLDIAFGWQRVSCGELRHILDEISRVILVFEPVFEGFPPRRLWRPGWLPPDLVPPTF